MEQQPYPQPAYQRQANSFATASIVCGILSMFSCIVVYAALFFGSLSILFGLLSRREALTMPTSSQAGCILSSRSMVLSVILTALAVAFLVQLFGWETVLDPEKLMEEYMSYLNSIGGMIP